MCSLHRAWIFLFLFFLGATGCAGVGRFDPVPRGQVVELGPKEGLLVVHTMSDIPVQSIKVNGSPLLKGLKPGLGFRVYAAPAGTYRWTEVQVEPRASAYFSQPKFFFWKLAAEKAWEIRVEPGQINYGGQFLVKSVGSRRLLHMRIVNRSALALQTLRSRYPQLLEKYPMAYTGPDKDPFLDLYFDRDNEPNAEPVKEVE